jgi:hypothetical protein
MIIRVGKRQRSYLDFLICFSIRNEGFAEALNISKRRKTKKQLSGCNRLFFPEFSQPLSYAHETVIPKKWGKIA